MAEVVGGFLMPHNPALVAMADDSAQAHTVRGAFNHISQRLEALEASTVIIIGDDHYTMFGPHCIPSCLIGIGDVEGPIDEDFLRLKSGRIENNEPLANHILQAGFADGIDWAFAKALAVDHAVAIPHHLAVKALPGVKTIPVYLNAGVFPVIPSRRAYQIGQSILRAVRSWPGDDRVVLFGTGGVSHWVGYAEMGRVNADFDRRILAMVERRDVEGLLALSDETILEQAGNGCLEIKNWLCAMGATPGAKAEVIVYEPMPQWVTGMGFAELDVAA